MTLEYVTSAKETLSWKIMRVFTILNLYLYNIPGCFSLQIQSLLIIKINLSLYIIKKCTRDSTQQSSSFTYNITVFVYLFIENSGCIPLIWFTSSIYTDFNSRCMFTLIVILAVDVWCIS